MDGTKSSISRSPTSISPHQLRRRLGTAQAPLVIDVRRPADVAASDRCIVSSFHRPPDEVAQWSRDLPAGRPVVVHCVRGHQVSQTAAAALAAAGVDAAYLEGGIAAWIEAGLPTRRKVAGATAKWVTRERPKIDRIACPWLVARFIDPHAEFIYVPASEVLATAKKTGAIPYDIAGVAYGHVGERCSFDAIVRDFDIHDRALDRVATIVRGADTGRLDLAPECDGLFAISRGLSDNFADDREQLAHGMVMYDALYAWCRVQEAAQASAGQPALRVAH
jgi:rhodanese-related sulfurtransferase